MEQTDGRVADGETPDRCFSLTARHSQRNNDWAHFCRRHHKTCFAKIKWCRQFLRDSRQDTNAGNSLFAIPIAEVSLDRRRFRVLPVIGAARRWLRLTGKVWLPICVLRSRWNRWSAELWSKTYSLQGGPKTNRLKWLTLSVILIDTIMPILFLI